jgi:AcrR family transcriptional regulator
MSSKAEAAAARLPKRERGRQRVAELLSAAAQVFAEKGYEAATMTEIAARAGAPIGSLYQFFPAKEALADTLVQRYLTALTADMTAIESRAAEIDLRSLVESLFGVMRAHPEERAACQPMVERMDEKTRQATFRPQLRRRIAAILQARAPSLPAETARDMAIVVLQLMKAGGALSDEDALPGRAAAQRDLQAIAVQYLEERLGVQP